MSSESGFAPGAMLGGKYRVERILGQGGMGAVYLAENIDIGRRVAIKVLRPEMAGQPEALARFKQEARNAASVGHPGIVEILDLGTLDDGGAFIVMEALDGQTLRERLQATGTLSPREAAELLAQVLDTLAVAHDKGVIHRDLKPDNLFLVERPVPGIRILDFGISKLTGSSDVALTRTGAVMGTPLYMSPEQASGSKSIGPATDLYSVGAILYEALSGQPPFPGESYGEVLAQVLTAQQRPVEALRPDVPPPLSNLIQELLSKDQTKRPPGARATSLRLRQSGSLPDRPDQTVLSTSGPMLLNQPTPSHDTQPISGPAPASVQGPAPAPIRVPQRNPVVAPPSKSSGSGGLVLGLVGLVVLGVAGVAAYFGWQAMQPKPVVAVVMPPPTPPLPTPPPPRPFPAGPIPAHPLPPAVPLPAICNQQRCAVYVATRHRLYAMDALHPGAPTPLCNFGGALLPSTEVNDIAVSPEGTLFGITADALYEINPHTCAGARVMVVTQKYPFNGLTWDRDGTLLASDPTGALFTIDRVTNQVRPAGTVGAGLASSGDLVTTAEGTFVAARDPLAPAGTPDVLVQLDAQHHFVRRIAPLPGTDFYALGFWGGSLYAFDKLGRGFAVDPSSGTARPLGSVPGADFYGAGSTPAAPVR